MAKFTVSDGTLYINGKPVQFKDMVLTVEEGEHIKTSDDQVDREAGVVKLRRPIQIGVPAMLTYGFGRKKRQRKKAQWKQEIRGRKP